MKCDNIHCFKKAEPLCSIIFTRPSNQISYNLCKDCYKLVLLSTKMLIDVETQATVAQSGRASV